MVLKNLKDLKDSESHRAIPRTRTRRGWGHRSVKLDKQRTELPPASAEASWDAPARSRTGTPQDHGCTPPVFVKLVPPSFGCQLTPGRLAAVPTASKLAVLAPEAFARCAGGSVCSRGAMCPLEALEVLLRSFALTGFGTDARLPCHLRKNRNVFRVLPSPLSSRD